MKDIRAASVQFNHAAGDKDFNMAKIRAFIEEAHAKKIDLVVFPEMCITGYWHVRKLSREEVESLFDLPQGARVGVLICYDNNIGKNVRITALKGAEILLAPHQTGGCNSPSPHCMGRIDLQLWQNREKDPDAIEAEFRGPKGRAWLMHWLPARAHDNGMFLIYSNGVGRDDDEVRTGNAMILDPYGEILTETWQARDDMVVADLQASLLDMCTGQRWIKSRRPSLYQPLVMPTGKEDETRKVRFERKS
jgi:predicted amidohydrolase